MKVAALALVLLGIACDEPAPPPSAPTMGTLTVAVREEIREIPYATVRCDAEGDVQRVEVLGSQVLPDGQPRVLIARLRGDDVVEAHAFAPLVSFAGYDYDMVQFIAADVEGAKKPDCRIERGAEQTTLICNDTTMIPWLGTGERPQPSFKIGFACPP